MRFNAHMNLPGTKDVGAKVSIRLFASGGGFRDILGILETQSSVRKKNGELVEFDSAKIALWKLIPDQAGGTGLFLYNTQSREIEEVLARVGKRLTSTAAARRSIAMLMSEICVLSCFPTLFQGSWLSMVGTP